MDLLAAARLGRELLNQYGLRSWRFRFDRAVRRFGCCHYSTATISLSAALTAMNSEAEVRDTLLHEIAHAIAGKQAGHGDEWRKYAAILGARPERCYTNEVLAPQARYVAHCPTCRKQYERQRAPRRKTACSVCCRQWNAGRYTDRFLLVFRRAAVS
jgi:predicted SprT family Zn-dependent metalloprotease